MADCSGALESGGRFFLFVTDSDSKSNFGSSHWIVPLSRPRLRTLGRFANVNLGSNARRPRVSFSNMSFECVGYIGLDQVDCASAKSSSGHASAVDTRTGRSQMHQEIQLLATYLVVVT